MLYKPGRMIFYTIEQRSNIFKTMTFLAKLRTRHSRVAFYDDEITNKRLLTWITIFKTFFS